MSYVAEALSLYNPTRQQERNDKPGISGSLLIARPASGFCECCRRHKPAPKKRKKGWRCDECKSEKPA